MSNDYTDAIAILESFRFINLYKLEKLRNHTSADVEKLENMQKIFTREIPEVNHLKYWEKPNKIEMISQEKRMERIK